MKEENLAASNGELTQLDKNCLVGKAQYGVREHHIPKSVKTRKRRFRLRQNFSQGEMQEYLVEVGCQPVQCFYDVGSSRGTGTNNAKGSGQPCSEGQIL